MDPLNVPGDVCLLQTCVWANLTGEFFSLAVHPVEVQLEVLLLVSLEMALGSGAKDIPHGKWLHCLHIVHLSEVRLQDLWSCSVVL